MEGWVGDTPGTRSPCRVTGRGKNEDEACRRNHTGREGTQQPGGREEGGVYRERRRKGC